jgi:hypothetical protein
MEVRVLRLRTDGALNAPELGLTVDALDGSALTIEGLVGRGGAVEEYALQTTKFDSDLADAALVFEKLLMLAGLARGMRKEERATEALSAVARGGH